MKKLMIIAVVTMATMLSSCTDAERSKLSGYGDNYKVEMLNSDGSIAREWISSGKVQSEQTSDGYFFKDKNTGKLVEVTGCLVITKL